MRGQIWHCKEISWTAVKSEHHLPECLVLFECFETGDGESVITEVVRRVKQVNEKRFQLDTLAVFPFSHLSSDLLPLAEAKSLHGLLVQEAIKHFRIVESLPFNIGKEVVLHLAGKNEDVSFFEY